MNKTLLLIGTLVLAGLASAKSYDNMIISAPVMAAGQQLAAGEYVLQLKGSTAIFTNLGSGKVVTAPVKNVKNAAQPFRNTLVERVAKDGTPQITSIELGGSNTMIELGE